jgi:chitin disaccharide deacetylase
MKNAQTEMVPEAMFANQAVKREPRVAVGKPGSGHLIINADDWGRDRETTDRTFDCVHRGTVSAVSAMVFMEDSRRAAGISRESGIDTGLHLNFSASFTSTSSDCPAGLAEHQRKLAAYLRRHALARVVFHPGLANSFEYSVNAQLEEFQKLFGHAPERLDGHHHLHLCANVQRADLLPAHTMVRRNFSFQSGEKSWINRVYRKRMDQKLARRHRLVDYLFPLPPLEPARLKRIFNLAVDHAVELETHPVNPAEYKFLTGGEIICQLGEALIAPGFPHAVKAAL